MMHRKSATLLSSVCSGEKLVGSDDEISVPMSPPIHSALNDETQRRTG